MYLVLKLVYVFNLPSEIPCDGTFDLSIETFCLLSPEAASLIPQDTPKHEMPHIALGFPLFSEDL